jgi:hypothetical protein
VVQTIILTGSQGTVCTYGGAAAGACLALAGTGQYGPSFWKLAALDLQLGIRQPSLSDAACMAPLFLRPATDASAVTVLNLAAYDAGALVYLLHAHHAPHHKLKLDTCYCLSSPAAEEAARTLPGLVQCVRLQGADSLSEASSQEQKLACFTADSSRHVCGHVQEADVVLGSHIILVLQGLQQTPHSCTVMLARQTLHLVRTSICTTLESHHD